MSITYRQAADILFATYGVDWSHDDYEWHRDMIEWIREYPSVKALRRQHRFVVPPWWPGAQSGRQVASHGASVAH